jgi:predicted DNA-binding ribbon-helix-helix protein
MKSLVHKRSVALGHHKTSVSLEQDFWDGLKEISRLQGKRVSVLIAEIERTRDRGNLSSALRLFVLDYYRERGPQPQRFYAGESSLGI